ncbi:MAG: hypothetical protein XE02_0809 [Mesotoga infera]|uniref:Rubrerythrin diiron-binding domain-containing protein n=1 Tax=Mesotoga infera TaxID=1236046 RepID=A0A101I6W1_9BACT|nr:MAG: hypothetical protein XE02_0809 [Mesotoga infera]
MMEAEELAVLKYALAREREGVKFYRERSKEIHVPEVKELFSQLAEMEMDEHKKLRKRKLRTFSICFLPGKKTIKRH